MSVLIFVSAEGFSSDLSFSLRSFAGHPAHSGPEGPPGLHGVAGVLPPGAVHPADRKTADTPLLPHTRQEAVNFTSATHKTTYLLRMSYGCCG